ncbi:hypothetical protein [Lysinibacillus sp. FSL W8-0992]|uniref:hypothetical protein n=1 Tax=Lysinibacillus sp. FSL W8-0992 TaxID=2954643 RepID=UPI0030FC357E
MKTIELSYEGTVFNKIAGNESKAMYYNEKLNNLLIVTTDEKAEMQKNYAESIAEELKNGDIDEDEVTFDENGNIIVELDDVEFNDTIEDAFNYIVNDRWDDFCIAAEYSKNTVILIHKPYYTTTDYIINYDFNPKGFIVKLVTEAIENFYAQLPEEMIPYKTIEIAKGIAYRFGDIPDAVIEEIRTGNFL